MAKQVNAGQLPPLTTSPELQKAHEDLARWSGEARKLREKIVTLQGECSLSGSQLKQQAEALRAGKPIDLNFTAPDELLAAKRELAILDEAARMQAKDIEQLQLEQSRQADQHLRPYLENLYREHLFLRIKLAELRAKRVAAGDELSRRGIALVSPLWGELSSHADDLAEHDSVLVQNTVAAIEAGILTGKESELAPLLSSRGGDYLRHAMQTRKAG